MSPLVIWHRVVVPWHCVAHMWVYPDSCLHTDNLSLSTRQHKSHPALPASLRPSSCLLISEVGGDGRRRQQEVRAWPALDCQRSECRQKPDVFYDGDLLSSPPQRMCLDGTWLVKSGYYYSYFFGLVSNVKDTDEETKRHSCDQTFQKVVSAPCKHDQCPVRLKYWRLLLHNPIL